MDKTNEILKAALDSDEAFGATLRKQMGELGLTAQEFAKRAGISASTLYKLTNEGRSPSLEVLRRIVNTIRSEEGFRAGNFIALIVTRRVLDEVVERSVQIDGQTVRVREYPAATMEDAIISAIRAERDGAVAIVCAPIVSPTIEKILDIPIATIVPKDSVTEAIKLAARKSRI